ncbi:hypothetical protein H5410_041219 [Solanum commersonii]|uniref:Reverse transcriptase zinc-binding domain-containing protein n=1 Tax=Solanum commersonii TaxID=4109 RepID=A0A9J5XR74_SOLCO|nr:hypothetical protein H5410_041219 [Solanum commersonii]
MRFLYLPKNEGGVGFRYLLYVSNVLFCKLWWNLRSKPSLWGSIKANNYCKKLHPIIAKCRGALAIWKKMKAVRDLVEHQIWCSIPHHTRCNRRRGLGQIVSVDEIVQRMGINLVSKCWCCQALNQETFSHLFLTSATAAKLWRLFANFIGIELEVL